MNFAKKRLLNEKKRKKKDIFADISMFIYIVLKVNICFEVNI